MSTTDTSKGQGGDSGPPRRVRVSKACEPCKRGRRKCSGDLPCSYCVHRKVECFYSTKPNKKRGPKPISKRLQALEEENAALKADIARMRENLLQREYEQETKHGNTVHDSDDKPTGISNTEQFFSKLTLSEQDTSDNGTPTLAVSEKEEATLRAYFSMVNSLLPAVDEKSFWVSLNHYRANNIDSDATVGNNHSDHVHGSSDEAPRFTSKSDYAAFQVLLYTMLCAGAKVQGRRKQAKQYYESARQAIGSCFSLPSSHLVSALVIMTTVCRVMCAGVKGNCGLTPVEVAKQAAIHATLAHKMCELIPVSDTVRATALVVAAANSEWDIFPRISEAKQLPAPDLFACNFSWIVKQIMENFNSVEVDPESLPTITLFDPSMKKHVAAENNTTNPTTLDLTSGTVLETNQSGDMECNTTTKCDDMAAQLASSTPTPVSPSTETEKLSLGEFFTLLDETLVLHKDMGFFSAFPLQAVVYGIKGLLLLRCTPEQYERGLDFARQCIHIASTEDLARYSYPLVVLVARLLPAIQMALKVLTTVKNSVPLSLAQDACDFISSSAKAQPRMDGCPDAAPQGDVPCPKQSTDPNMTVSHIALRVPTSEDSLGSLGSNLCDPSKLTSAEVSTLNEHGIDETSIAHAHAIATMNPKPDEKTREMRRLAKEMPQLTCPRAVVRASAAIAPFGNPVVDNITGNKRNRNTGTGKDTTDRSHTTIKATNSTTGAETNKTRLVLVSNSTYPATSKLNTSDRSDSQTPGAVSSSSGTTDDMHTQVKPKILPDLLPDVSLSRMNSLEGLRIGIATSPMASPSLATTQPSTFLDSSWITMTEGVFGDLGGYFDEVSDDANSTPGSSTSHTPSTASTAPSHIIASNSNGIPFSSDGNSHTHDPLTSSTSNAQGSPAQGPSGYGTDSPLSTHVTTDLNPLTTQYPWNSPIPVIGSNTGLQPHPTSNQGGISPIANIMPTLQSHGVPPEVTFPSSSLPEDGPLDDATSVTSLGLQLFPPGLRAAASALSTPVNSQSTWNEKAPQQSARLLPSLEMGLNSGELEQLERMLGWDMTPA